MRFSAHSLLLASALSSLVPQYQALPNPSKDLARRAGPIDLDPAAAPHPNPHPDPHTNPNDPNSGGGHRGGSSNAAGGSTLHDDPGTGYPKLANDNTGDAVRQGDTGKSPDGAPYILTSMNQIDKQIPQNKRIPVFFTDQGPSTDAKAFITDGVQPLNGQGFTFEDAFTQQWFKDNKIGPAAGEPRNAAYWVTVYRSSNALSRTSTGSRVYVALDKSQDRTIFSGVQTYKADGSIDHVGNGQVWVQAELPALMRNTNTQQIVSIFRDQQGKWQQHLEWDVNRPGDKPRDFVPQVPLDSATSVDLVPNSVKPS